MRKAIFSLVALVLFAAFDTASAYTVVLQAHNQRSNSGTLSTLVWKTCPPAIANGCINPANSWVVANGVTGSDATWDWNPVTRVLTGTGRYEATSYISSNPSGLPVIDDRTVDLVIDQINQTSSATSYRCLEGAFLASVGANGCLNISLGFDATLQSSAIYNVGGNANCIQRTINGLDPVNGDDADTGNPRGVQTFLATGACDAVDGGYNLYTLLIDDTTIPALDGTRKLRISNGTAISNPSTNYMTFVAVPDAVDDGPVPGTPAVPVSIDVLANDNAFTDPVTVAITSLPSKGTATVVGTSPGPQAGITIQYTGTVGATGTDSFVYTVTDADNVTTDAATVRIEFGANDDNPTVRMNFSTPSYTPVNIPIGANDSFAGDVTTTITVPPDQGGSAGPPSAPGPVAAQVVPYTPAQKALYTPTYTETFTYEMTDGTVTDAAVVTVTVANGVPDAPVGTVNIPTTGVAPLNAAGTFTVPTGNLGDNGTVAVTQQGTKGQATVNAQGTAITYTVTDATFFTGSDTIGYSITDSDGETDAGTVNVTLPPATPTLTNGTITTTAGTASAPRALGITLGNGSAAQNLLSVSTQATDGSCALSGTSVTYTPNAGFGGSDSCVITITDEGGAGQSDTGTISVTVNAAGGGGGGSGVSLPSAGALDLWSLSLLAGLPLVRRRRRAV